LFPVSVEKVSERSMAGRKYQTAKGSDAHTLKPLERDRLVIMEIDADDRRDRLITLTAEGRGKLTETDALWAAAQRGFEIAFGRAMHAVGDQPSDRCVMR
jgi:DNA-binding MarR family transcriptional regulator